MKNFYEFIAYIGNSLRSLFLLAVRLFWGYLFFSAGKGKLFALGKTAEAFQSLNIPFPHFSATLVGCVEMFGGILLILGLASRLVSIPLIITMITAFMVAHSDSFKEFFDNPSAVLSQTPFTFLMAALIIFIFGPGLFSLDKLLEKKFKSR